MKSSTQLYEGRPLPVLLRFTLPVLLSILLQVTYGTVDLLVVGQFSGVADVSGVTIGSQVMQTVTSFCTGLSMGTTILLGRYIGAREEEKTTRTVGVSIALFTLLGVLVTLALLLCNGLIVSAMRTPTEAISQASGYLYTTGAGAIFIVFYNLLGSIFRGIGDSKTPLIAVAIACVVNVCLDLIFVALFGMGAAGAALATVIAQASSVILSILMLRGRTLPFTVEKQSIGLDRDYTPRIIKLGLPISLQSSMVGLSFLAVTAIINVFGVTASAAVGIVEKITGIIMVVPLAFMQSLSAFTAQNCGAGRFDRARLGMLYAVAISLTFGVITAYLSMFHGTIFTRLFTNEPDTTVAALAYLKSYCWDTIFVAVLFTMTGFFNGCGRTGFVMVQAVVAAFLIRVPLAYLFSTFENTSLYLIGFATPLSTLLQIVMCVWYYLREKSTLGEPR